MLCPRREEIGPSTMFKLPAEDTYRDNGSCSYCGSYDPRKVMARLEAGTVELGATDKNYKVYLHPTTGSEPFNLGGGTGKFYFQHFSEEQRRRFVELFNERKLKFSGGFGFYVFPFFMTPAT